LARVALLTQHLTPQALGLAQALKMHRHEMILITSAQEPVPDDLGIQVLTYFKKWSAVEALRFFPKLLGQSPEVWHFVFADTKKESPTAAHWVLSHLARALPGRVVATSFYDSVLQISPFKAKPFLKSCDIVTTATRENLMFLKRKAWIQRDCETEVLPPMVSERLSPTTGEVEQDLSQLVTAASPFLIIPTQKLPDLDWAPILNKMNLVVCGHRPARAQKGVFYVGTDLSESQFLEVLRSSRGLITAFEDLSVVELLNYQRICSATRTLTLAQPRQTEAVPGFCVPKRNGFLVRNMSQLNSLLLENPKLELQNPLFEPVKTDLSDSALNELNRLYSKVRHQKTSSFDFKRSSLS
jgi:hypothetical protein